ncbi:hypothetical protein ACLOJK_024311 [Asimina triloba]
MVQRLLLSCRGDWPALNRCWRLDLGWVPWCVCWLGDDRWRPDGGGAKMPGLLGSTMNDLLGCHGERCRFWVAWIRDLPLTELIRWATMIVGPLLHPMNIGFSMEKNADWPLLRCAARDRDGVAGSGCWSSSMADALI